jgi:hypothetical protein
MKCSSIINSYHPIGRVDWKGIVSAIINLEGKIETIIEIEFQEKAGPRARFALLMHLM